MAKHYQLGPLYFKTKKAAKRSIKIILGQPCELSGQELEIVKDLFKHSPKRQMIESRGGVRQFVIDDISKNGVTNKRFMAICKNGNHIPFAYEDCLDNYKDVTTKVNQRKRREATFSDLVDDACRSAIEGVINDFRNNLAYNKGHGADICPISGYILDWWNAEVDHDDPYPLDVIIENFIMSLGFDLNTLDELQPNILEARPKDNRIRFVSNDTDRMFIAFHNKYAKLRFITKEENGKRVAAQKARKTERRQIV